MALALLDTYSINSSGASSATVDDVVVSGTNTICLVAVTVYNNDSTSDRVITSVVRNSENFTRIDSATIDDGETDGERIEFWYKLNPSSGTSDVVATITGACSQLNVFVSVLTGALQSAPTIVDTQEDATGTTHALSLTTTEDDSFIMGAIYTWDDVVGSNGTNQTTIATLDSGYTRSSYEMVGSAGSHDHSYTTDSNSRCVYSAVAIEPAGGTAYTQDLDEIVTLVDALTRSTMKVLIETPVIVDTILKSLDRTLTETPSVTDTISKGGGKSLVESLSASDSIVLKITGKLLTEAITIVDATSRSIGRLLTDALAMTDTLLIALGKNLSEIISVSDTLSNILGKLLTETIALGDSLSKSTARLLSEAITATDTLSVKITGRHLSETINVRGTLYLIFNGLYVGIWSKVERAYEAWTKVEKPDE